MKREKLRNIGPKTEFWLDQIGIYNKKQLEKLGAEKVYEMIVETGHERHRALLYALIGAELDLSWQEVQDMVKSSQLKIGKSK